jgi:hypothetical protein
MEGKQVVSDLALGILIGFALSVSFYLIWGAFQLLGFLLWSIVAGGGGALAGRLLLGSRRGAVGGALLLRFAVFALFGGVFF